MGKPLGATGVKWHQPYTELGRAMREDQARAALLIIEALEQVGWRIQRAAALLGYRDYCQLDAYVRRLGLRKLVQRNRYGATAHNMACNYRSTALVTRLRAAGDEDGARAVVWAAIRVEHGNVQRAAKRLGVSESGMRTYVRTLGLSDDVTKLRLSAQGHYRARARHQAWVESRRKK